jgi:nitrogen fixation NifU-like protein
MPRRAASLTAATLRRRHGAGFEGEHSLSDYSKTFLDHYRRPRNLGDLDGADAVAILHDAKCGDILRLALALEGAHGGVRRVRVARFKAYGCAATIAVGSVLTELVAGKSLGELAALTERHLIEALDGLPAGRLHAALLGRDALRAAVARLPDPAP